MKWNKDLLHLATPRLKVSVSEQEITASLPKNSGHCMIAEAVKKCFLERFHRLPVAVHVDLQTIRLTDKVKRLRHIYFTPAIAQAKLIDFDQGKNIQPFNFNIKGGQVIALRKQSKQKDTVARRELKKNACKNAMAIENIKKARLKMTNQIGSNSPVVTKIGGVAPPEAILSGKRREYGLKLAVA